MYRQFGTKEDLYEAVYERWMESSQAVIAEVRRNDLDGFLQRLAELWRTQAEDPGLASAMSTYTSAGRAVRRRRRARRRKVAVDLVAPLPVAESDRRRLEAMVLLLTSTTAHRHLREYWDMSTDEAAQTASWAIRALVRAARAGG